MRNVIFAINITLDGCCDHPSKLLMTKMATIPENYNKIRAGIVELLKTARSSAARNVNIH
ncbi:MAG: hypothetical protein WCA49_02480 [Candidatus Sulfotelmatobacter sp.]